MSRRKPKSPVVRVAVGDFVLLGGTRASMPSDWYLGSVLWVGDEDILVGRSDMTGCEKWRQVEPLASVRVVGPISRLVVVKNKAVEETRELSMRVHDAEAELGRARAAVFAKLDELAKGGLAIEPPDFEAIDGYHAEMRRRVEAVDDAEAAS